MDTSVPGTDRIGRMAMVSRASWDCRRIVSSSPQLRMISIGRGRIPVALGKTERPGCFSMTRTRDAGSGQGGGGGEAGRAGPDNDDVVLVVA